VPVPPPSGDGVVEGALRTHEPLGKRGGIAWNRRIRGRRRSSGGRRRGRRVAGGSAADPASAQRERDRDRGERYAAESSSFPNWRIWKARTMSVTPWKSAQIPANTSSVYAFSTKN
jgi:hypothetical protein